MASKKVSSRALVEGTLWVLYVDSVVESSGPAALLSLSPNVGFSEFTIQSTKIPDGIKSALVASRTKNVLLLGSFWNAELPSALLEFSNRKFYLYTPEETNGISSSPNLKVCSGKASNIGPIAFLVDVLVDAGMFTPPFSMVFECNKDFCEAVDDRVLKRKNRHTQEVYAGLTNYPELAKEPTVFDQHLRVFEGTVKYGAILETGRKVVSKRLVIISRM